MGFFDRIFGKKSKSSSTSTNSATTTPINPSWVSGGLETLGNKVIGLSALDPRTFVAGPSALQTKAFDAAGGLKLSDDYGRARGIFNDVAGAGANTYDATGYDPTKATSRGYDSVDWTGQGYDFTKAGEAVGYDPTSAQAVTYNASSLLEGLDKYMSPYTGQVVDAALNDFDFGAGQTRANQALEEARSGAFGGSGAAIGRSLTEGEIMRGRGSLSAQLRDQGFMRGAGLSAQDAGFRNDAARFNADAQTRVNMSNAEAANAAAAMRAAAQNQFKLTDAEAANAAAAFGANARNTSAASNAGARNEALRFGADAANRVDLANADAANTAARFGADAKNEAGRFNASAEDAALARQLQAGNALSALGETMGADTRANIALQAALGGDQRAIEQAFAEAPLEVLQALSATFGGLPLNLLSGSSMTSTGSSQGVNKSFDPWGTVSNIFQAAGPAMTAVAMSDRRLKTDIEKIGEREDGLGVYVYRYLWSPVRFIGVMAQEVLKVKPEAVIHTPSGYMAVNYGAL